MSDDVNPVLMRATLRAAQDAHDADDGEACVTALLLLMEDLRKMYPRPTTPGQPR